MKAFAKVLPILICFWQTQVRAEGVADLLQTGVIAKHVVVPLYPTNSAKLLAILRVNHAFKDYEHRGFFRIGALPIGVLDGVTFEAQDKSDPMAGLQCVRRFLAGKAGQRIEMRQAKFFFSPTNRVEAGLIKCAAADRWDLTKGVRYVSGSDELKASKGTLRWLGNDGCQLILESKPRFTNTFITR